MIDRPRRNLEHPFRRRQRAARERERNFRVLSALVQEWSARPPEDWQALKKTNRAVDRPPIAQRIRAVRAALQMTQMEFANAIGAALPTVKDYEGGKCVPGGERLAGFARAGVNVGWLLTGKGTMLSRHTGEDACRNDQKS
jgi:DNA-binding transcriptional regulator YiaG